MSHTTPDERPAERGEYCTCGRPAVAVRASGPSHEVAWCGTNNLPPVRPCRFCGQDDPDHVDQKCPEYQLRPEVKSE